MKSWLLVGALLVGGVAFGQASNTRARFNAPVYGPVGLSNGLVGTPSLYFIGDTNTGIYWVSADNFCAVTGGVARACWNSAGTTTISSLLSLNGDVRPLSDNAQDIGVSGTFRFRSLYLSGSPFLEAATGTAASGTGITANTTSAIRNWLHKVTVINTALAAAATSDVTLHVTPVNTRIIRVVADVTQVFTGGALTAVTVMCGNAAGGNQYLLANSVFTATNTWGDVVAEMGAGLVDATRADFGTVAAGVPGAITVQCRFTCTTANCNAATQGSVTFYVEGVTYP